MLDNQYEDRKRYRFVELVKAGYLRFFDGFVYGGDTHRDYLRRLSVRPDREILGYNCVDNDAIRMMADTARRQGARLGPERPYFLCVARLVAKKNLLRLVEAYSRYLGSVEYQKPPWMLVIVGEGPMRATLERAIDQLGLQGNVLLVGEVRKFESVVNYHAFANAFILASDRDEQWGLVVNEAMAAARPVLVSRHCGCASTLVREGENGFTFDGGDVQQIADRLTLMHRREHELESMGAKSLELIANVSPQRLAESIGLLYQMRRRALAYPPPGNS